MKGPLMESGPFHIIAVGLERELLIGYPTKVAFLLHLWPLLKL